MKQVKDNENAQPWERQEGETQEAFYAFAAYRDMGLTAGKRSLTELAKQAINGRKRSWAQLSQWSYRNNWVVRCKLYDNYLDREKQKAVIDERERMVRRHLRLAEGAQKAAWQPIATLLKRYKDPDSLEGMSTNELLKLVDRYTSAIEKMIKIERLVSGVSTDKVEVAGGFGVGQPSKDKSFMELVQSDNTALRLWNRLMSRLAELKQERQEEEEES